ncbi:MAG: DMT family transporter [Pseudomonadota bacterium]
MSFVRLFLLLLVVLVAFAANSVIGRIALEDGLIDAASYTAIRLLSGAAMLMVLVALRGGEDVAFERSLLISAKTLGMAVALFAYAALFSFAYLELGAALGALVLFGAVQITMIGWNVMTGSRLTFVEWLGVAVAVAGFVYLVAPTAPGTPEPVETSGFGSMIMMTLSGVAWGAYSLAGRGISDPLGATARNFVVATPLGVLTVVVFFSTLQISPTGLALAILSGAITSGLGYALWYRALPFITPTVAAVLQLTVPLIAAAGGVLFLSEALDWRFAIATVAILGGVGATVLGGARSPTR